jgi:hypothetical protein
MELGLFFTEFLACLSHPNSNSFYDNFLEVIFGYAPFVSNSLDELEKKILDDTPIQVS